MHGLDRQRTFLAVGVLLLIAPATAQSSGFDVFGMGARGAAMASASVSNAADYTAIYYNPAGMVLRGSTLGVGFMVSFDNAEINLSERPEGYEIPNLGVNTPTIPSEFRLRPRSNVDSVDSLVGIVLGATTTLGFERFRAGVAALIPVSSAEAQSVFSDEREQFFSNRLNFDLLGRRIQHQVVLFGVAYEILDWLAIGAGLSFMIGAPTNSVVHVPDLTDLGDVDINVAISLASRFRPNVGLLVYPGDDFRVGVAFRDQQELKITGINEVQVRGLHEEEFPFEQTFDLTLQYSPRQLIWGLSYIAGPVLMSADATLSFWSGFVDNHGGGTDFSNTITPRLGVEWTVAENDWIRFGVAFEPTPVPEQSGRTSFVDNSRFLGSVGTEHLIELFGSELRIGWHFQMHYLLPNSETKTALDSYPDCEPGVTSLCDEIPDDAINPATGRPYPEATGLQTGNPGFPGWSSGGWIAAAGLDLSWEF